ncbi:MAG: hypothetical protein mread185_000625 [Mycoplasmataceae bacterium]|nr:MAG: hypothetical protein mread185_000625 [Mycoplasmataceae bacterium]
MDKKQELLNIIEKYITPSDYTFVGYENGNVNCGEIFEQRKVYTIISPELKKEICHSIFGDIIIEGVEFSHQEDKKNWWKLLKMRRRTN